MNVNSIKIIHPKKHLPGSTNSMLQQYVIDESTLIGQGTYAKVYLATKKKYMKFACKVIRKDKIDKLQICNKALGCQIRKHIETQISFMTRLRQCSHIVKVHEVIQDEQAYYIMMQYCDNNLSEIIKSKGIINQNQALDYFQQLLQGYQHIYDCNAAHRDLKPENLLIKNGVLKISDFGFVKIFDHKNNKLHKSSLRQLTLRTQTKIGTVRYMSPDILGMSNKENKSYDAQKGDVWSMGIILYKMLYGRQPFEGIDEKSMMQNIHNFKLTFSKSVILSKDEMYINVSNNIIQLLKKMLDINEATRLSFKELSDEVEALIRIKAIAQTQYNLGQYGKNKYEKLAIVYKIIIQEIYNNSVSQATLRQIGIVNYYQFSCKLMTLIHQKRMICLEDSLQQEELNEFIKSEIYTYENTFAQPIRRLSKIKKQQTLISLLMKIYTLLNKYKDYNYLMDTVQSYLLNLLIFLACQLQLITTQQMWEEFQTSITCQDILLEKKKYYMNLLDISNGFNVHNNNANKSININEHYNIDNGNIDNNIDNNNSDNVNFVANNNLISNEDINSNFNLNPNPNYNQNSNMNLQVQSNMNPKSNLNTNLLRSKSASLDIRKKNTEKFMSRHRALAK